MMSSGSLTIGSAHSALQRKGRVAICVRPGLPDAVDEVSDVSEKGHQGPLPLWLGLCPMLVVFGGMRGFIHCRAPFLIEVQGPRERARSHISVLRISQVCTQLL